MKDEWYADNRDLVKWSVLLHVAEQHNVQRILQVAYYRPSVWHEVEIDGHSYPVPKPVIEHFRSIGRVSHLVAGCDVKVLDDPFTHRDTYAALVRDAIAERTGEPQLVFLDPDTGLAPTRPGLQHVLDAELTAIWKALRLGDVLVLYQHKTNRSGQPWLDAKRRQFERALGLLEGDARVAMAPEIASDVAFFFSVRRPQWTPLNMTLAEWGENVGDYVLHEGTILRTGRGVFSAGIEGGFYIGQKREDGTVDGSTKDDWPNWPWVEETEVVIEYADPPEGYPDGCHRMSNGGIHCVCEP